MSSRLGIQETIYHLFHYAWLYSAEDNELLQCHPEGKMIVTLQQTTVWIISAVPICKRPKQTCCG